MYIDGIQQSFAAIITIAIPQIAGLNQKRMRTETPSQLMAAHVEDITRTTRSTRIRYLIPGSDDEHPLGHILEKLVAMDSIQFGDKEGGLRRSPTRRRFGSRHPSSSQSRF